MLYNDQHFDASTVNLDGNQFVNCRFTNSRLVFHAEEPVSFDQCVFVDCDWVFGGSADIMLGFLEALYHGLGASGEHLVGAIFEGIRQGTLERSTPARVSA